MKRFLSMLLVCAVALTVLCFNVSAASAPDLLAESAILYAESDDGAYSAVLYEKNADAKMYPASLVKIMTAIVALESGYPLDREMLAYANVLSSYTSTYNQKVMYLGNGERMTFSDFLHYMLIPSNNEAAEVIAVNIILNNNFDSLTNIVSADTARASISEFVQLMNDKAKEIGCTSTSFANVHGLDEDNNYTTARDYLKIAQYAMENDTIADIVSKKDFTLPVSNKHSSTSTISTTNELLKSTYRYPNIFGLKTGSTTNAGKCLAAVCKKDGMTYYSIVLKSIKSEDGKDHRYTDTRALFDYAADGFSVQTLLKPTHPIAEIPVTLSSDGTSIILLPEKSLSDLIPNTFNYNEDVVFESQLEEGADTTGKVVLSYNAPESIEAPVEKGQAVGSLTIKFEGRTYEMALLSSSTLTKSQVLETADKVEGFFQSKLFIILLIAFIALIVLMIIVTIILSSRSKKRKRYGRGKYSR